MFKRDALHWWFGMFGAAAIALSAHIDALPHFLVPYKEYIQYGAVAYVWISSYLRMSPLPLSDSNPMKGTHEESIEIKTVTPNNPNSI